MIIQVLQLDIFYLQGFLQVNQGIVANGGYQVKFLLHQADRLFRDRFA